MVTMMQPSLPSSLIASTPFAWDWDGDLDVATSWTIPLYVFPKHHAPILNAKVNAISAIKKSTMM
jgi:hypothetical protein